jgi:hypothetical protein
MLCGKGFDVALLNTIFSVMRIKSLFVFACTCCMLNGYAQYTTDKVLGPKNQDLADSLKKMEYPYMLPIWGKKVVAKGFNIPKSAGISAQYLYQQSDILITDLAVGFNNGPLHPLDQIIRFNSAVATSNGVNVRPDIWLFPFLNVYGILAKSNTSTAINAGVWLPDSSGWHEVTNLSTKANFNATTLGFGVTPSIAVRGYFFILDMNFTWSDVDALEKPAFVSIIGPRFGKNITLKKKDRNIAMWIGGFRVKMGSSTFGSLNTAELFPIDQWQDKIDNSYQKLQESQQKVDVWWNGLSSTEQKNPANVAKHEAANTALATFGKVVDGASQIVSGAGESSVQYSLNKTQKKMWNFLVGSQYQINRSWMVRAEYGFLGARQQLIFGLQYRFNL